MSETITPEILEDMRRITMLTGEISRVHEVSLRHWPMILFDDINNVKVEYDLTKDYHKEAGKGYINFFVALDVEGPSKEVLKEKGDILAGWVRDMFWKEIEVGVIINNGEEYYNGLN